MEAIIMILGLLAITSWTYGAFLGGKYVLLNKKAPWYDKTTVVVGFVIAVLYFIGSN